MDSGGYLKEMLTECPPRISAWGWGTVTNSAEHSPCFSRAFSLESDPEAMARVQCEEGECVCWGGRVSLEQVGGRRWQAGQ